MGHKEASDRIFLLGGHDLEMLEIRRMLETRCVRFEDKGLDWNNARLSSYANIISSLPDADYYGVELQEDFPPPKNYIRIDHHNDDNNRPAAILQVAGLLGIEPDRHLRLVAANDAGYIPAMQALGASEAEISDIRHRDRAAQGVTEEDERLAEQSIADNLTTAGCLLVVCSLTPHFSTICDRLFPYRQLLIYTDEEWTYYGEGKAELVYLLENEIKQKRVYHGGGENGFIGASKGVFPSRHIFSFVDIIRQKYGKV